MSDKTAVSAVSVKCDLLYADWFDGIKLLLSRYLANCEHTSLSMSFEITDRLDIGR